MLNVKIKGKGSQLFLASGIEGHLGWLLNPLEEWVLSPKSNLLAFRLSES